MYWLMFIAEHMHTFKIHMFSYLHTYIHIILCMYCCTTINNVHTYTSIIIIVWYIYICTLTKDTKHISIWWAIVEKFIFVRIQYIRVIWKNDLSHYLLFLFLYLSYLVYLLNKKQYSFSMLRLYSLVINLLEKKSCQQSPN